MALLSTVGTSILSNLEGSVKGEDCMLYGKGNKPIRPVSRVLCDLLNPPNKPKPSRAPPDDPIQFEFLKRATPGDPVFREVLEIVGSDPGRFSAELNSMMAFFNSLPARHSISEVEVYLYPTDTGTARFCANVVYELIRERGVGLLGIAKVTPYEPIVVKGFGAGPTFFSEGLVELIDKYARLIVSKARQGFKVVVNATAGFKPETTYTALIALMSCAWRVIYMHESFREIVELPMLPIGIRQDYLGVLGKVGNGAPRYVLKQQGVDVDDLLERGLVEEVNGLIKPREWVRRLLDVVNECSKVS